MTFIISIIIHTLVLALVIGLVLAIPIFILLSKLKTKESSKKNSLKGVDTIIFDVNNLTEDIEESVIDLNKNLSFKNLLNALDNLKNDDKIKRIILDIDKLSLSTVHIEELRSIFEELSKTKEIISIGSTYDEHSYRIATLADKIYMLDTRQSSIFFRGYQYKEPYFKNFLSKFGIKINVLHIGEYKVAGESFAKDRMTEEKKESYRNIFETIFNDFITLVKKRRNTDITDEVLEGNLIFADYEKAKALNLIDGLSTLDDLNVDFNENTIRFQNYLSLHKKKKNKIKDIIAVINLEGEISFSEGRKINITYDKVVEKLEQLEDIKNLKALILRINSPGGSALESERIYKKLKQVKVPIYVSMGQYCASGGYYLATVGKKIFANNLTLTGSIGVVMMYPDFSKSLEKIDLNMEEISKGSGFDIFDNFTELSEESKNKIIYAMNETYIEFKNHVKESRNISEEELEKIAGGRVWLGSQAKNIGLVDEIGSFKDSLECLARDLNLEKYKVIHIRSKKSLGETINSLKPKLLENIYLENLRELNLKSNKILFLEEDIYNTFK